MCDSVARDEVVSKAVFVDRINMLRRSQKQEPRVSLELTKKSQALLALVPPDPGVV